jgi:hypothetical protein
MKNSMETMQRLASQMDGLSIASRGLRAIRPAKKIVAMPKRVKKEKILEGVKEEKAGIKISNFRDSAICTHSDDTNKGGNSPEFNTNVNDLPQHIINEIDIEDQTDGREKTEEILHKLDDKKPVKNRTENRSNQIEEPSDKMCGKIDHTCGQSCVAKKVKFEITQRPSENTSGYGSETSTETGSSGSAEQGLDGKTVGLQENSEKENETHCVRCHKMYDPLSKSTAEMRCSLPHPTKNVIPIKRDAFGTDFVCLCCRTEFRLPKMAFYEAGVNSMLTGFCFIGQHTQDPNEIDYQQHGGAALSCEEAGCIEYFV